MVINKNKVKDLLSIEGQARGMHFTTDGDFVLKKKGQKGLKDLEKELTRLGCPIKYQKINNLGFYPIGWRPISLLTIKKIFNWGDKEVKQICGYAAGVSLIVKLYMKFFYSLPKIIEKSPMIWKEYFTKGELEVVDYSEEKQYAIFRVHDFKLDPVFCRCLEGYFANIIQMIVKTKKSTCKEIKCAFENHDFHEFKLKW